MAFPCLAQLSCYVLRKCVSQDSRNACFQEVPVAFIICKYLLAGFVTWWRYEPVKLESGWLCTTETQNRVPACVNQCSSSESDGAGSTYSRWGAPVTGDIAPKWPVIRHHPAFSLFKPASTASLQTTACYAACWPFAYSKGHWCLSHTLCEVREKPPQQELWHCFSLIGALLWSVPEALPACFVWAWTAAFDSRVAPVPALCCGFKTQGHCKCLAAVLRNTSTLGSWSSCILIPSIWKPLVLLKWQISELAFPHNHRY